MEPDTAQWKIERIIIDNLPDNYKFAKLEEITKNSILIENSLRLPILGKRCNIHIRGSRLTREGTKLGLSQPSEKLLPISEATTNRPAPLYSELAKYYPAQHREEGIVHAASGRDTENVIPVEKPVEEKKEDTAEDASICDKILKTIQEDFTASKIEGSPSPIKKSKQEHQRLVAKLKYQIPDEWQKPFNKHEVLAEASKKNPEEWGNVNRRTEQLWKKIGDHARKERSPGRTLDGSKKIPPPLSNYMLRESLGEGKSKEKKSLAKSCAEGMGENKKTDVTEAGNYVMEDMVQKLKDYQHLMTKDDLKKIQELGVNLDDPLDFGLFLAELKNKFNEKYRSPYLNSIGIALPYRSRRHDMGGVIEPQEWPDFFGKLDKLAERVKRKRHRIISQRKKRGKALLPRKYIYKPPRRPDMSKNSEI